MTNQARIIIIGGGIVGCSILYHLGKAGCTDALLLERAELTAGATWHAAGNVHTQSAIPNLSKLQIYSLKLYDSLAAEVGQAVDSHVVGGFFLAQSSERMTEFKHLAGKFKALGIDYELVTPAEIKAKHPLINTDGLYGGAWDPDEGYVDPYSVTMGLAAGARRFGCRIERNTQVQKIERTPSGFRLTSHARTFECEIIVNAAGFWADEVANMLGTRLPITNMEHHYLVTETMPAVQAQTTELPMIRDMDWDFYMRQEGQGLLVGPWEQDCRAAWQNQPAPWTFGQELFEPDLERLEPYLERICSRVPAFADAGIKRIVNGAISFSPDGRPMIGPMPGVPNCFVACGFLGGIAQAGGIGLAMSQWILEGEPEYDLAPIDVARFGKWAPDGFATNRTREIFPRRYEIIYPQMERSQGRGLKHTAIHKQLIEQGAVMGQAFGWERPRWFAPQGVEPIDQPSFKRPNWFDHVGNECRAVHQTAGLIDMSSYAKFEISGPDAEIFLNQLLTCTLPASPGKTKLGLILNQRGGIIGDLTITKLENGRFYAVGASIAEQIYCRWLETRASAFNATIAVVTDQMGALGLAGPNAATILNKAQNRLGPAHPGLVMKISYSGEQGFEIHMLRDAHNDWYNAIIQAGQDHGLKHAGARALNWLRLEKGYRSWGAELSTEITPAAAGLLNLCSTKKTYTGKAAVDASRHTPPAKRLATLEVDALDADCWGSEPIFHRNKLAGYVTSGGYGFRVNKSLAVGWIDTAASAPGTQLEVEILAERRPAKILTDPIFDPDNQRLKSHA